MNRHAFLLLAACSGTAFSPLSAQIARDSARLAELVVTAHRDSVPPRVRPSAADVLGPAERAARGALRLGDALALLPGTTIVTSGAPGGVASTFLRGVNSNQTLLLIDGIRVNDANTLGSALLGGFDLDRHDRVEVVRGPQGPLHGGAAIGGLIAIRAETPAADRASATVSAGHFASYQGLFDGAIVRPRWSASVGGSFADAENERPLNETDRRSQRAAVTVRPTDRLEVGVTGRGLQSSYRSPGDLRTSNSTPDGLTKFDHLLVTGFANAALTDRWVSRLTLGGQRYFLEGRSRFNGGSEFVSRLATSRRVVDWHHRLAVADWLSTVAGVTADWSEVTDQEETRNERQRGGYLELSLRPRPDLAITAGVRHDDHKSYGGSSTGRIGVGYFIPKMRTKIRGTFGTGFLPPSLTARYGGPFQRGNPGLLAERSRGWDAGIDQYLLADRAVASLSLFGNALRDLIGFESAPFPELGRAVNIARARTRGLELAGRAAVGRIDGRMAYTWLTATDLAALTPETERLIRRPRHAIALDLAWSSSRAGFGVSARGAFDREDADFNAFPSARVDPGDYLDLGLRGRWRMAGNVGAEVRADNLTDNRYEDVYGFPALGRRLSVALTVEAP
ncbi:MAG: TonB-dependent receptor [Gemmatimonadetes bacterium]|nr:TonB-dependent receptor [Gemmatimonadota bacterium]